MSSAEIEIRDITRWAGEKESHDGLPELVHRLLRETPGVTRIDLPTGDSSRYRGWDGLVTATAGSVWLPEGRSCWEIGCDADAKKKADSDYGNRIRDTKGIDPATVTYICVTPRQWAGGRAWAAGKTATGPWKEVRVLDAGDLLQWLADCRRAALWFRVTVMKDEKSRQKWNDVTIGWDPDALRYEAGPLSWLTWRARLTEELFGRDEERADLLRWAREGGGVRFRLLVGEGGSGKTRLAHEVADELARDSTWAAGQVTHTDRPLPLDAGQDGCLLLIDYPEEKREQIRERLAELAAYRANGRTVRVLLLTRQGEEYWQSLIDDTGVGAKWTTPLYLREGVASDDAYRLYSAALARVPVEGARPDPVPISAEAFQDWLRRAPVNQRPLLIAAAAVQAVHEPARSVTSLTGPEVIQALARREASRLRRLGKRHGLGEDALVRLSALAAVRGGLDEEDIVRLAAPNLDLGFKEVAGLIDRLAEAGLLTGNCLRAPEPDIVAAALLSDVLAARPAKSTQWLGAAISGAEVEAIERLGRLIHDAEVPLGRTERWISISIAKVPETDITSCEKFETILDDNWLAPGLLPFAIGVCKGIIYSCNAPARKAKISYFMSNHLGRIGDYEAAIKIGYDSVELYRSIKPFRSGNLEFQYVEALNNLSSCLFSVGLHDKARAVAQEAVEAAERLSLERDPIYILQYALSLRNYSLWLLDIDLEFLALREMRLSVELLRSLSVDKSEKIQAELAMSLNMLGVLETRKGQDGHLHLEEGEKIRRELMLRRPERFEQDWAVSLDNLAISFIKNGNFDKARECNQKSMKILENAMKITPDATAPYFGCSLWTQARLREACNDRHGAIEFIVQAISLIEPTARAYPNSRRGRWYVQMVDMLHRLRSA